MKTNVRRLLCLVLALVLCFGLIPGVSAAEVDTPGPDLQAEDISSPATEETTAPTIEETTVPTTETTEPSTTEPETSEPITDEEAAAADDGMILFSGDKRSGVTLLDLASPYNYTIYLPSQVYVKYNPNGSDAAKTAGLKNIGWHYYSYGGVADKNNTIYCIEPYKNYNAGSPGNYVDEGVDVYGSNTTGSVGSNAWYNMPSSYRKAISYILQYSEMRWDHSVSVTSVSKSSNPNFPLRTATQVLIYEIVMGLRNPDTFERNDSNGYVEGRILYDAFKDQVTDFRASYNALVSDVQNAELRPSFTSSSSSNAPTITLTGNLTWVTDTNGVCGQFTFNEDDDIWFNVYDTEVGIQIPYGFTGTKLYSCYKTRPSTGSSTFNVFYGSSSYQSCVNLLDPASSSTYGYFKVYKAPSTGSLNIIKTTSDGQNLSGWQFGIYSNSVCTSLAGGPYTTNSSGKISVTGLAAGTYYVKETGHTSSATAAKYTCTSTNPQSVTITAGGTSSVSFTNTLKPGTLNLTKTTEDSKNLSGWQFGIYSNSSCTTLTSGPHTTDASGKISVTGLTAGTYYVKELRHTDSAINALYYCSSTNPQAVTVTAGRTSSVSFTNKLNTGSVKLIKATNTGVNLSGWQIGLFTDVACTNAVSGSPFTTGTDGTVTISNLQPGTYYAKELPTDDPYWEFDAAVKSITVAVGQTAEVTFTNTHYGRIEFRKTTNTGSHLGGWIFRVQDSNGNTIGEYTTDENGYACTENLLLGRYTVVELPTEDNYWLTELGFHDVTVKAGETTVDTWLNKEQGLVWFHKKTNTGESVKGWHITVYSDEDCTQKVGTLITNEDGRAGYYLDPGTYWAKETGDELGRFEDEYWMVDETVQKFEIKPHEDVSITFTNVQYGRLEITKTVEGDGSVEGWAFKITDSEGKTLDGSPFTTDKNGIILTDNLLPGQYTVEELLPEDSLYQCKGENPLTVTVIQGETAKVSFTNTLRPGKIIVNKADIHNDPLAGATFLLEWSEDGALWYPVTYSQTLAQGGCSNPDLADGCLTSKEDGAMVWDGLYPSLQYRVTEVKAPDGYRLLERSAFEGTLPTDDFEVTIRVINSRTFTLPNTGGNTAMIFRILSMISGTVCLAMLIYSKKRLV